MSVLGSVRRPQIDRQRQDSVLEFRRRVPEHREVLVVQFGLLDELLALGPLNRRDSTALDRLGPLAEPLDHCFGVEITRHGQPSYGRAGVAIPTMPFMSIAPTVTTDVDEAAADLDREGYCLLAGALEAARVTRLRELLLAISEAEIAEGTDYVYENGSNQRIWTLLNKGDEFVDLALDPAVHRLMARLLGPSFLLSNLDANIAGPGGQPMFLHADQSFIPPPWPPYPMVANAIWMIDDFTAENGATRVVPGSHLLGHGPDGTGEVVSVVAPAGTVMIFDGRLWHQTGPNVTADVRRHTILAYYCRPFIRTQENWFLSIAPAVVERRPEIRGLVGYDNFLSLGMVDGMPRTGLRF